MKGWELTNREIQELRLEVQELRQFCIMLIYNTPHEVIRSATRDYWWEKLSGYAKVENNVD